MPKIEADFLKMTNEVMIAFLTRNAARPEQVADLMRSVHATFVELAGREPPPLLAPPPKPAVPISASVKPDRLACLECSRNLRSLRFHLKKHGLSPTGYRAKWNLPVDYPMVAPNLAEKRSALAFESEFGHYRKHRAKGAEPAN